MRTPRRPRRPSRHPRSYMDAIRAALCAHGPAPAPPPPAETPIERPRLPLPRTVRPLFV